MRIKRIDEYNMMTFEEKERYWIKIGPDGIIDEKLYWKHLSQNTDNWA